MSAAVLSASYLTDRRRSSLTVDSDAKCSPLSRSFSQNYLLHPRSHMSRANRSCATQQSSRTHFRPITYQTQEELESFFGTTKAQSRNRALRVRETEGRVYYDTLEREEWRGLLSAKTPDRTSYLQPQPGERRNSNASTASIGTGRWNRRNSSVVTSLSAGSRISIVVPREYTDDMGSRRASEGGMMSPLSNLFSGVNLQQAQAPRRLKRANSAVARGNFVPDAPMIYPEQNRTQTETGTSVTWVAISPFKRRQSVQIAESDLTASAPTNRALPSRRLERTRAPEMLDLVTQAKLRRHSSPNATPSTGSFLSPSGFSFAASTFEVSRTKAIPSSSSLLALPQAPEGRRGTFGSDRERPVTEMSKHDFSPVPVSAGATSMLSSATTVEYIDSPIFSPVYALRHTASLKDFHRPQRLAGTIASRPVLAARSSDPVRQVRRYDSASSLFSLNSDVGESFAPADGYSTALAPRTGARKFDASRHALLSRSSSPALSTIAKAVVVPPPSDPYLKSTDSVEMKAANTDEAVKAIRRRAVLGTGAHVYDGIDIPCASIHLHSDPEDNPAPAVAVANANTKSRAKKLKHKKLTLSISEEQSTSALHQTKHNGLTRWFTSLGK